VGSSSGGIGLTVIDGATGTTSLYSTPASPAVLAVNPVTNRIYVANSSGNTATVVSEESVQSIPLSVSIQALANNQTASPTPSLTFSAQSSFNPTAPLPQGVLYQVDTWQGPWLRTTGNGLTFAGITSALAPGFHIVFAYADDGQDATSTQCPAPRRFLKPEA
jgi:hypothetical protein